MTLLSRKKNAQPAVMTDLFDTGRFMSPSIFDFDGDLGPESSLMIPDVNVMENDKDFKIELAAPGLERKDFKVEVDNDVLTISAEKEEERKEERENYKRREFSYNSFSRSLILPENSMPDKIDAKYENGILKLSLPKKEITKSTPKKAINVS